MRIAIEQGMHTDMQSRYLAESTVERSREAWWTVYVLDRQMSSLLGVPLALSDEDVTAHLPSFAGSTQKSLALNIQIKISKATAMIQQSKQRLCSYDDESLTEASAVYRREYRRNERLLKCMKEALKIIASANDERSESFPLDLQNPEKGVSRLSAYLHLFHHQVSVPLSACLWAYTLVLKFDSALFSLLGLCSSVSGRSDCNPPLAYELHLKEVRDRCCAFVLPLLSRASTY